MAPILSCGDTAALIPTVWKMRAQEVWEMPCGTEGTCAVIVPDGRILYIGATGGVQGQTAAGVDISGKDPAKTYFYYEPLK